MLNIAGNKKIDDPEYRYKMPRIIGKIEGRGNGIKTVVVNCVELASALHRTPAEVCKFFGCELGAQSKYDAETERAVVNGAFTTQDMQSHLSKYIEGFVLCPQCGLPETKYKYRNESVFHKCFACGADEPIDMSHKLTNFIVQQRKKMKKNKAKDDTKEKKKEKKKKDKKGNTEDGAVDEEEEKKKKKEKKVKRKKEAENDLPKAEEIEWHTDLSEEAVAARMEEEHQIEKAAQNALAVDEDIAVTLDNLEVDDSIAIETAVSAVQDFMKSSPSESDLFDEIKRQQVYSALPPSQKLVILFNAVFNEKIISESQISKNASLLNKCAVSSDEKYLLLAHIEHFCANTFPELLPSFPVLLKFFYDEDIVEEEHILKWSTVRSNFALPCVTLDHWKKLNESMQPFLVWLQNAEEESAEESD